jgi:DNA-binding phage protein
MNEIQQTVVAMPVRKPGHQLLREEKILSRSRLYSLVPYAIGGIWRESLTGYINRLGWTHHISPRAFVAEMVIPRLKEDLGLPLPAAAMFGAHGAMSLNGTGELASTAVALLKHLTVRMDLHLLTLPWWVGDLPRRGQLRETPAWCPSCLAGWRTQGLPLYQPLLWMFQMVTICPGHRTFLVDRCPWCQKHQMIIATNKTQPGECTACGAFLGEDSRNCSGQLDNEAHIAWQQWVISVLKELLTVSRACGPIQWEPFFRHLANYLKEHKAYSKLARLAGITRQALHRWGNNDDTYTPTLQTLLKFCYACNVTPLQVMRNQLDHLQHASSQGTEGDSSLPHRPMRRVDRERCQALLQAVLDGREELLGVYPIAQRLGYAESSLLYHFPQQCAEITQRAKAYRKQRKEQRLVLICEQVRQATIDVHALGRYPSQDTVQSFLPNHLMRMQEARAVWRATLRELGCEP